VHEDFYDSTEPVQSIRFVISSGQEQTLARLFAAGVPPARQAVKIHKYGVALEILALLRREALCDELGDYDVQNGLFQSFFRLCIASCPDEFFNPEFLLRSPQKHIHGKILAAFEEHVFSNPTLAELCKRCEMTPSFLSRRCWELFAQPPLKAFLNYKIQQVKRKMIENPNLKLKELSDIFGFENQFHFSRVFKSYAGLPPSAFSQRPDAGRRQGLRRNAAR
jgi:AraC-like DNA-binding protein